MATVPGMHLPVLPPPHLYSFLYHKHFSSKVFPIPNLSKLFFTCWLENCGTIWLKFSNCLMQHEFMSSLHEGGLSWAQAFVIPGMVPSGIRANLWSIHLVGQQARLGGHIPKEVISVSNLRSNFKSRSDF